MRRIRCTVTSKKKAESAVDTTRIITERTILSPVNLLLGLESGHTRNSFARPKAGQAYDAGSLENPPETAHSTEVLVPVPSPRRDRTASPVTMGPPSPHRPA